MDRESNNILQWNTRGVTTAKQDILKLIDRFHPTVLGFQETMLANECKIKLKGYQGIVKQGRFNQRQHGGVALYIHESCPHKEIAIQSEYQVVAARVTIGRRTTITVLDLSSSVCCSVMSPQLII